MKYDIITYTRGVNESKEEAAKNMAAKVNSYLEKGWELNGGLFVDDKTFYQSIKFETSGEEK